MDSGGLMPFLLDTQYRSHPVIAEATKTATKKRLVESDDPMGKPKELKGFEVDERQVILNVFLVKEWIRIDEFQSFTLVAYEARGCSCCSRQVVTCASL